MINFQPPYLTNKDDINTIGELMRIGSQGEENSKYDQVDTTLLKSP